MTSNAEQNLELERLTAAKATANLRTELGIVPTVLVRADLTGETPAAKRRLADELLSRVVPVVRPGIEHGAELGRRLGHRQFSVNDADTEPIEDQSLEDVILTTDVRVSARLAEAVQLADQLPMTESSDMLAVVAKARSSITLAETDAAWAVQRSVALGVGEAAVAEDQRVVWVAERNACLHCLAYQGRVVDPGKRFPPGLTYGDQPLKPFGLLLGPPLHPHCRCELEPTDAEHGSIVPELAREAARSVARGLTDFSSGEGRYRAVERLLSGTTGLPKVQLPKTVLERAARNLAARKFKARPGSPEARLEIAQRARDRARASSR